MIATIAYPSVVEECCTVCSSGSRTNGTAYCAPQCGTDRYSAHRSLHLPLSGLHWSPFPVLTGSQGVLSGHSRGTRTCRSVAFQLWSSARLPCVSAPNRIRVASCPYHSTSCGIAWCKWPTTSHLLIVCFACITQRRCCMTRADCSTRRIPRSDRESCGFRTVRLRHPSRTL